MLGLSWFLSPRNAAGPPHQVSKPRPTRLVLKLEQLKCWAERGKAGLGQSCSALLQFWGAHIPVIYLMAPQTLGLCPLLSLAPWGPHTARPSESRRQQLFIPGYSQAASRRRSHAKRLLFCPQLTMIDRLMASKLFCLLSQLTKFALVFSRSRPHLSSDMINAAGKTEKEPAASAC